MHFLLFLLLPFSLLAIQGTTELRLNTFYPSSSLVRKIYGTNKIGAEFESSLFLQENFSIWLNVNYLKCQGHSEGLKQRTSLELLPGSAGFKSIVPLSKWFKIAFGTGISYSFITVHDHSEILKKKIRKSAWGAVAKTALIYYINDWLFADLFADYYYSKIKHHGHTRQMGGLRCGVGVGVGY